MKKIILILIALILLTGCSGVYNLNSFILPDDSEFLALIEELNTPETTCQYMEDNFEYEDNSITLNPYQLFIAKVENCDGLSLFAIFMADCNGYETYQIFMKHPFWVYGTSKGHVIGVFKEGNYYNISDTTSYIECNCKTFEEIMELYPDYISYTVYDCDMNIVDEVYSN